MTVGEPSPGRREGRALALALALATLLLVGGCDRAAAPAASAPGPAASDAAATARSGAAASAVPAAPTASAVAGHRVTVDGRPAADGRAWQFTLVCDAPPGPDGLATVRAVEIRQAGSPDVVQRIDGLDTSTPVAAGAMGLEQPDMDFDGIPDLRVQAGQPAGPNVPWRHWLYVPASGRFVAAPALDDLTSPTFDGARREVVDTWRDGPTRYGTDRWRWQDGGLVRVQREVREGRRPGVWTVRTYTGQGGDWVLQSTKEVRQP